MTFELNDLTMIMKFENKEEEKGIKSFITFKDESGAFGRGGFDIRKIKNKCMGKDVKEYFVCFAGFCKEILIYCKQNKIKISSFKDNRTHFPFQEKEYSDEELRKYFDPKFKYVDHQIREVRAMLKTNKGLIKAPTSSGKSATILAFLKLTKVRTIILNDRSLLATQLQGDLKAGGIDCGINCGGKFQDGYCIVSTIQSIKKIPNLDQFKCIIVDEVQRASAATFQDFFKSTSYPLMYGFSASPFNKNANSSFLQFAKIRQFFGSIIIDVGTEELIENGVMAKPIIHIVKCECPETLDYASAYDLGIVHNERRNKKIIDIAGRYDGKTAILISHIDQGKILNDNIPNSVFINGSTSNEDRKKAIDDFSSGKIKVLIGSDILKEGISIPAIDVIIISNSQKSFISSVQRIGRALRIRKEKSQAEIYDFYDSGNRFLEKHSRMRMRAYKDEGYKIADIEEDGVIKEVGK